MRRFVTEIVLSAFAAVVLAGVSFTPIANAQVHGDGQIVSNERIGPFRLGAPAADLIAVLGQPDETRFYEHEGMLVWHDGVGTGSTHTVLFASVRGPRMEVFHLALGGAGHGYTTPEGVTVGMSELDVQLRLGAPRERVRDPVEGFWWNFYPGMLLYTTGERGVTYIQICQRRYQHSGYGRGRWCY
jgi:hypothetical protein